MEQLSPVQPVLHLHMGTEFETTHAPLVAPLQDTPKLDNGHAAEESETNTYLRSNS